MTNLNDMIAAGLFGERESSRNMQLIGTLSRAGFIAIPREMCDNGVRFGHMRFEKSGVIEPKEFEVI